MGKQAEFKTVGVRLKEALIILVKEARPIWDISCGDHKKAAILTNCWIQIKSQLIEEFGLEVLEQHKMDRLEKMKEMWQSLRNQFRQHKKKMKGSSGSSLAEVATVKWQFFDMLRFLNQSVVAFPTVNSFQFQVLDDPDESFTAEPVGASGDNESTNVEPTPGTSRDYLEISATSSNQAKRKSVANDSPWDVLKQRKRNKTSSQIPDREKRNEAYFAALSMLTKGKDLEEDEDDIFGKLCAKKLKSLQQKYKMRAHAQILEVLHDLYDMQCTEDP